MSKQDVLEELENMELYIHNLKHDINNDKKIMPSSLWHMAMQASINKLK